jgi:hypothetical protein
MAAAGKLQQLSVLRGRSVYEDRSCQRGQLYEMAVVGDRGLRTVMQWSWRRCDDMMGSGQVRNSVEELVFWRPCWGNGRPPSDWSPRPGSNDRLSGPRRRPDKGEVRRHTAAVVRSAWCVVRGAWCVVRGAWCVTLQRRFQASRTPLSHAGQALTDADKADRIAERRYCTR